MKRLTIWLAVWFLSSMMVLAGPIFEPVAAFQAGPTGPENSGFLKHSDGFFYGTSRSGGAYGYGTIYRVSSAGEVTVMVHFSGASGAARGRRPQAELVDDGTGVLWGTTFLGGAGNFGDGFGTVFRFNPVTQDFTSITEFSGTGGFAKGSFPLAGLIRDGVGSLWGGTAAGGTGGHGTIFKVNTVNLVFTSVFDFTGSAGARRGRSPEATLVNDGAGAMWGTTADGGANGLGTLFTVNTATSELTTLVDFTGSGGSFLGSRPTAALRMGEAGVWWGGTSAGGAGGFGTIFRYTAAGGVMTTVAQFTGVGGSVPGRLPKVALVPDGAGSFLGTTNAGGAGDYGTIFKIDANSLTFSSLAQFTGPAGLMPGSIPYGALVPDQTGSFRGVTTDGGGSRLGTIYTIDATTGAFQSLVNFVKTQGSTAASNPGSGLVAGPDGLLWGTSENGGPANAGTLFTLNPVTGATSSALVFTGIAGDVPGANPVAELVNDGAGNLWGTTSAGGALNFGIVFKVNATSKVFTKITEFTGSNGRSPTGCLVYEASGFLWGTTSEGGSEQGGTIFKINAATGALTTVVHFTGTSGAFLGDGPSTGLTPDGAGFLWGTTYEGGGSNLGTVFKIKPADGSFLHIASLTGTEGAFKGDGPAHSLTADSDGFLWGTTEFGGSEGLGTVFKINRTDGSFTTVAEFTGPFGDLVGAGPQCSLIQDPVGAWYGTTESGGVGNRGTIFKISPDGTFRTIGGFTGSLGAVPGAKPRGGLMRHSDGHLYGTTSGGGALSTFIPAGNGQIFRLRLGPIPVTLTATAVEGTAARLQGMVNPNGAESTVTFEYGTSPALVGATLFSSGTTGAGDVPESVSAPLTGLLPSTVYYYRVRASNPENANLQTAGILSFTTSSGSAAGFKNWLSAAGIQGGVAEAGSDPDSDGTSNAMEFIFGGNPVLKDDPSTVAYAVTPDDLIFSFVRQDAAESPDVTLRVEAGTSPGTMSDSYLIGPSTGASGAGVQVQENGAAPDLITVAIPRNGSGAKFARLKVTIAP